MLYNGGMTVHVRCLLRFAVAKRLERLIYQIVDCRIERRVVEQLFCIGTYTLNSSCFSCSSCIVKKLSYLCVRGLRLDELKGDFHESHDLHKFERSF